jgi:hypothetical protein
VQAEGGQNDSLDQINVDNMTTKTMRLFFRRDTRCELEDLPHTVETLNFIYVDIDLQFKRTGSK